MTNPVGMPPRHGHSVGYKTSPTYNSWSAMRTRCNNPNKDGYEYYGGKGIRHCDEWATFEGFLADMGERPIGKTLDRIDTDGNYEPSNCRWSNIMVQNNNRTNNLNLTAFGKTQSCAMWAREIGITRHMLWNRLKRGWNVELAISEPSRTPWQDK